MLSLVKMFEVDKDPTNLNYFKVDAGGGLLFKLYWGPWDHRIHMICCSHRMRAHRLKVLRRKSFRIVHNNGSICNIFHIIP